MNEVSYEVTVRIEAPVDTVWDEVSTLDRLLGHVPAISSVQLGADGMTGSFTFVLSRLGRLWKRLETRAVVTEVTPPRSLQWRLETPSLEWEFVGTFELSPVGTDETTLVYRGTMRFSDRSAGPLHPIETDVLEEHLDTLANRIAGRAARHTLAERTLGDA
jgi:carbon monoxide dehydrogenase subunit G